MRDSGLLLCKLANGPYSVGRNLLTKHEGVVVHAQLAFQRHLVDFTVVEIEAVGAECEFRALTILDLFGKHERRSSRAHALQN